LNNALQNIDESTKIRLEKHNLQISGISLSLQRVQIGIGKTLHEMKDIPQKPKITKVS
jgi:hypothetical protein